MSHYVYALINPQNSNPYYIGKGQNCEIKNRRIKDHFQSYRLKMCPNRHKANKIKKLKRGGYTPKNHHEKIKTGLSKEKSYELEKFLISEIGIKNLTNIHEGGNGGRNEKAIQAITGEKNSSAKLTKRQVSEIKWITNHSKIKLKKIANRYNVGETAIGRIYREKSWKHVNEKQRPDWYNGQKQKRLSSQKRASEVKWLANNTEMNYPEIAEKYNLHRCTIEKYMGKRADKLKTSKPKWYDGPVVDLEKKKEEKRQRIEEIKWLCENTSLYHHEIAEKYDVRDSRPSQLHEEEVKKHINPKRPDWYNEKKTKREKRKRRIGEIKWAARNSEMKMKNTEVAEVYDVSKSTVSSIKNNRTWKNIEPKQPKEENLQLLQQEWKSGFRRKAEKIKWLVQNSEMSYNEIAGVYDTSGSTVRRIKFNQTWKDVDPEFPNEREEHFN